MRHTTQTTIACLALMSAASLAQAEGESNRLGLDTEGSNVCAVCLDDYLIVPGYRVACGSSRGIVSDQILQNLTLDYSWHNNGKVSDRTAPPEKAELRAADALPSLTPGDYGWLHSVEVVQIDGERNMLVKDLWLVDGKGTDADLKAAIDKITGEAAKGLKELKKKYDAKIAPLNNDLNAYTSLNGKPGTRHQYDATIGDLRTQIEALTKQKNTDLGDVNADKTELIKLAKERRQVRHMAGKMQIKLAKKLSQTFRLTGFSTANLHPGDRFSGPHNDGLQVAVAWQDPSGPPVLAAVDLLKNHLDSTGLHALLAKRKVKIEDFTQKMTEARHAKQGDAAVQAARQAMAQWIRNQGN